MSGRVSSWSRPLESRGPSACTDCRTLVAVARGALASSYGLDLPARARRHEVLLAPSLALGHEAVFAEEAQRKFQLFGPVEHHPGAGLSALIQQCLASVLLRVLLGPGGVGLSHRPVMRLPLAQLLEVVRLQPLQVPALACGLRPE